MKNAQLEKLKGSRISSGPNPGGALGRFGRDAAAPASRREQRKLDQARGLVPFAVKLDGELVKQLQALAHERKAELGDVVAGLLAKALAAK